MESNLKTWSLWPDEGTFSHPETPGLIAQVKKSAPARDVVKSQRWGRVRIFKNLKSSQQIVAESQLEYWFALHLFLDHDVAELGTQPETLEIVCAGARVKYTPDFWVNRRGTLFYVEVKPMSKLADPDVAEKLRRAKLHLNQRGVQFTVVTDRKILEPNPRRNAELIYRYRNCPRDADVVERMRDFLCGGARKIHDVERVVGGAVAQAHIMRALLFNELGFAAQEPLTPATWVWWTGSAAK
ncbi:MAG: TnsA endonuclease N-terminal domain-containing protein [Pseudomonadota bacterium]